MSTVVLESNERRGRRPVTPEDLKHTQNQMRSMFGDTALPPVLYKGRIIPTGVLGSRNVDKGRIA
ncbi:MAG: hypothetical protein Tp1125DCM00d2C21254131_27 [Prokaryotic dsDNA virus sp.]|nr:MAG: hypothetical protein Tp1125DCM00d2C21254131_27 [Prokaryotic dsDNA virus sp.]|tara:strand:+ start:1568 stop:1762 length:195 start_codon:yes stop_codon:yes gene_type:complete